MAFKQGIHGSVVFATGYVVGVDKWQLTATSEIFDITVLLGSDQATPIGSLKLPSIVYDWAGTFEAFLDSTPTNWSYQISTQAAAAAATFKAGGGDTLAGTIAISTTDVTNVVRELNRIVFTFEGSGNITPTIA